jgi:putative N6-adenine-specific DNA methylase
LLCVGEFYARSFEELFQQTRGLPWEELLPPDACFPVSGSSVRSQLHSVPDCQAVVKKAIVERLKETYAMERFPESGALYAVKVTLLKDRVTLTIDTSGPGLHKRGYRVKDVAAPMKETLAAALVQLSFWKEGRLLADPFCGSGTIPIEAAMLGANIAPGLSRSFASEAWDSIPQELWKEERKKAFQDIRQDADLRILASDIDPAAVAAARANAEEAGVDQWIRFRTAPFAEFQAPEAHGIVICNPPYGQRIGELDELERVYGQLGRFFGAHPGWSLYLITADKRFEELFGRARSGCAPGETPPPADRRRKLYNGRLETCYYQYYGQRPPKAEGPAAGAAR